MKTKITTIISMSLAICLAVLTLSTAVFAAGHSWEGTWEAGNAGWGTFVLTQDGNTVTGTYTGENGTISATASDGVLTGISTDGDGVSYEIKFTMSGDGKRFEIEFNSMRAGNPYSLWMSGGYAERVAPQPIQTSDKPSSWAAESVNKAIEAKLVPQSLQSKYTQAATRAEFCALAVALYENVKGAITDRKTFDDTKDINVEKAAAIGVVSGVGNNRFDPDAKLTREQAAVMLSRLADAVGKPFEKKAAAFADNGSISSWALESVGQVQAAGIMGGVGGNTFAPKDPYTREQSIVTVLRTYDAVKGGAVTTENLGGMTADIIKTVADGVYHMKVKGLTGDMKDVEMEIYAKGGMTAVLMEAEGMNVRMVTRDGKGYYVMDDIKMVLVGEVAEGEEVPLLGGEFDLTYAGEGTGDFNGKSYKYDEYRGKNGEQYFYFMDGGNLKGIRNIVDGVTSEMEIYVFDKNIPDAVFEIPEDYTVQEGFRTE